MASLLILVLFIFSYIVVGGIILSIVILPGETVEDARNRIYVQSLFWAILFQGATLGAQTWVKFSIDFDDEDDF